MQVSSKRNVTVLSVDVQIYLFMVQSMPYDIYPQCRSMPHISYNIPSNINLHSSIRSRSQHSQTLPIIFYNHGSRVSALDDAPDDPISKPVAHFFRDQPV